MEELKYKVAVETDRISPEELIDPGAIAALVALNEQIEQYKAQLKSLADAEKEQGQLSEDQLRQQEELKLALKDAQSEYRNVQKGIQTVDAAVKSSTNTYKGLVAENKALMEAMRNVPLDDTTGELERLQAQYNANNERLKEFDAALGNHQRNVGNYNGALGNVTNSLQGLPGPIGGAVTSIKTLNTVLKANPIGLVIAAVAGLIAMLSKLQPVVDFVSKSFQVLSNTVQFFVDKAAGFLGIIEETNITLAETIRQTAALADAEVRLRDSKREQIVLDAERNKRISELRLQEADRNRSEEERIAILQQIDRIEREGLNEKISLAKEELRIAEDRAAINHSDAATLEDIANKRAALIKLETDSNNFLREQTTKRTELEKRQLAEQERLQEEASKRRLERIKREEDERFNAWIRSEENIRLAQEASDRVEYIDLELDTQTELNDKLLAMDRMYADTLLQNLINQLETEGRYIQSAEMQRLTRQQELEQMFLDAGLEQYQAHLRAKEQADAEYQNIRAQAEEDSLKFQKDITDQKIANIQFAANAALAIGRNLFGETKALAVAQAIIDTLAAAVSVMRDTKGKLWQRLANAAVILSAGYANVKKILSTKPGSANTSGATATASSAMSTMAVTPAGTLINQGLTGGMFAQQVAGEFTPATSRERNITIDANVDRRGLAIAVREGERSIRTQQFDYK
jgi:DNA repair exonuclease SbcCD ATPase subunit